MGSSAIRVFIVEDDEETRARFATAVKSDSRTMLVGTASTAAAALFALPTVAPDVLVVDLGLPDMDGVEMIRRIVPALPGCDVLVVTVFGDESRVLAGIEAGAAGYILKESDRGELVDHIVDLRAGGSPITPVIARRVLQRVRGVLNRSRATATAGARLSDRQIEILKLISRGFSYSEISDRLGLSINTVKSHIKSCYKALSVDSAAAAVAQASRSGLLHDEAGGRGRR